MAFIDPDEQTPEMAKPSISIKDPTDSPVNTNEMVPNQSLSLIDPDSVYPPAGSNMEEFLVGMGRGMTNRAQGAKQFGLMMGHYLSGNLGDHSSPTYQAAKEYQAEVDEERKVYNRTPVAQSTAGKVGEVVGEVAAEAPVAAATMGRSAMGRAATSAGAGGLMGATTYIPEDAPEQQRVQNTALGLALGGGTSLGFDTARVNANLIQSKMRKALQEPDIIRSFREADQLSSETGIDFTLGQSTGSRSLLSYEAAAAQSERSADKVLSILNNQYRQAINRVNRTIGFFSRDETSPELVGNQLKRGMEDLVDSKIAVRNTEWDRNMSRAASMGGETPSFQATATASKLDEVLEELTDPSTDYPQSAVAKARELRDFASSPWTISQVQNRLKFWGRAAQGKGQIFSDLDTADKRRFAKDLKNALEQDLDSHIEANPSGESAYYLREARKAWQKHSQELDDLKNTVVGQALNKGGKPTSAEGFYKKIQGADASEIRALSGILDDADPSIMNNVRAQTIRDTLEKSRLGPEAPESLVDLDPAKFIKNLPDGDKFNAIFGDSVGKTELIKTMRAIRKIADRGNVAGAGQSPLGSTTEAGGLIGGAVSGGAVGLPDSVFVGRFLAKNISPQRYAYLLMTKEGRKAVENISKWNTIPKKTLIASIGSLMGVLTEDSVEPTGEPIE